MRPAAVLFLAALFPLVVFAGDAGADDAEIAPPSLERDELVAYRYLIAPSEEVEYIIVKRDGGFFFDAPRRRGAAQDRQLRFACLTPRQKRNLKALLHKAGTRGRNVAGHELKHFAGHGVTYRSDGRRRRITGSPTYSKALPMPARRVLRRLHKLQRELKRESVRVPVHPPPPRDAWRCRR